MTTGQNGPPGDKRSSARPVADYLARQDDVVALARHVVAVHRQGADQDELTRAIQGLARALADRDRAPGS